MRAVLIGAAAAVLVATAGGVADGRQPEKIDAKLLVGKWEQKGPDGKFSAVAEYTKDGKVEQAVSFDGMKGFHLKGTYKLEGNKLELRFAEDGKEIKTTLTVVRLTQTELHTREGKEIDVWTRLKDKK